MTALLGMTRTTLMRRTIFSILIAALAASLLHAQETATIRVDSNARLGPYKPIYAYFGYDEPNYTYMPNGRKLVGELAQLSPVPVYIRAHNLLTTGDGTPALKWGSTNAYTEDASGKPDRKSTRLNSSHIQKSRMPSSA